MSGGCSARRCLPVSPPLFVFEPGQSSRFVPVFVLPFSPTGSCWHFFERLALPGSCCSACGRASQRARRRRSKKKRGNRAGKNSRSLSREFSPESVGALGLSPCSTCTCPGSPLAGVAGTLSPAWGAPVRIRSAAVGAMLGGNLRGLFGLALGYDGSGLDCWPEGMV